jgi:hypothetical protein
MISAAMRPNLHASSDVATVKETGARSALAEAKGELARVFDAVETARASVPGWDNLAFVKAFAAAYAKAQPLLSTSTNPVLRRLLGKSLLRLVPPALLPQPWSQAPPALALHLDDAVLARVDDGFRLGRADAPRVHPSWSAFLARPGLSEGVLAPRRHEYLLAPRSLSPGAHDGDAGSAVLVRVDDVSAGVARLRVFHKDGSSSLRRLTSDGKDAGPAELKLDVLRGWLENAGPGARALDLRRLDDRALWANFVHTLRTRRLDVLLAKDADPARRADVIDAVIDAAADAVATATLDPVSCRFVVPTDESWGQEAARLLLATGAVVEVAPRVAVRTTPPTAAPPSTSQSTSTSPSSKKAQNRPARHFVWLDAVVDGGVVGGALSTVGQARAFGRLAVSFLAPLGVLPLCGARDGRGVVVTVLSEDTSGAPRQRGPYWVEPGWPAALVAPLAQAWGEGRARHLPEPRGAFAHDVAALPAWLGHFADAVGGPDVDAAAVSVDAVDNDAVDAVDAVDNDAVGVDDTDSGSEIA